MFAATFCTIVSGAVVERIKLIPFLIFCIFFVSFCYPVTGYWKWGTGWLDAMGFYDFAGSALVHSVGGWGALAGAILLAPRTSHLAPQSIALKTLSPFPVIICHWPPWGFSYCGSGGSVLMEDQFYLLIRE